MNALVVVLATLALTHPIQAERPRLETRPLELEPTRADTLALALKDVPTTEKEIKPLVPVFPRIDEEKGTSETMGTQRKVAIGAGIVVALMVVAGILILMVLNEVLAIGAPSSKGAEPAGKLAEAAPARPIAGPHVSF